MKRILIAAVMVGLAGGAYAADFNDLDGVKAAGLKALSAAEGLAVPEASKGYVEEAGPADQIEWVTIPGGKFTMGTTSIEPGFEDAKPVHEVSIKTFEMAKTAVTVAQYAECVVKGYCTEPVIIKNCSSNIVVGLESDDQCKEDIEDCNWGKPGRQLHPVNCVDWNQAQAYAKFKGARLPSESEWEYAATGGGRSQKYPWGNEAPTSELAVFNTNRTMPVCSKPKGNTAQGLCDMAGNVWQWVQDKYQDSYKGAPINGSAVKGAGTHRVLRGGSFGNHDSRYLRVDYRHDYGPGHRYDGFGFRLVR